MSNIYTVELAVYTPPGVLKALLPDWETIEVQEELSAVGAIKMTYPRRGLNYTSIGDLDELAFVMNGQEKFRFVVEEWSGQSEDADQGNAVETIAGRSFVSVLDRAVVYPPNWPSATPPHHKYTSATVGQMMSSQISRAKARGGLLDVTYTFNSTLASDGQAWIDNDIDVELKAGTNLLTLHDQWVESGLIESRMVGKELKLYNNSDSSEFTDRTLSVPPVILRLGRDITTAPRTRSARLLRNAVLVEGNNNRYVSRNDPTSMAQFERREEYARAGGYRAFAHLNKYGDRVVAKHKMVQEQHSFELALHGGGPVPWINYNVGDKVWADLGAGLMAVRVLTIAAKFDRDGVRSASVTLGSRMIAPSRGLLKVVQGEVGSPTPAVPLSSPPIVSDALDIMPPAQVIGVGGTGATYADGGQHKALVNLSWAQVVTNEDGTLLEDFANYMIQYKPTAVTDWSASATVPAPGAQIRELVPGVSYDFRVSAVDTNFNIGLWSSTYTIVVPVDTTAPNAPSTPVVAGTFYGVTVTWNGLDSGGAAMPADFSHVEVHMSTVSGFTPGAATIKASFVNRAGESITLPSTAYGVTHYVKLRALDNAQNVSAASAQASGVPARLVDTDIIADGIGIDRIAFKDFGNIWPDGSFETAWARARPNDLGWTYVNDTNSPHGNWHARYTPANAAAAPSFPKLLGPTSIVVEAGERYWCRYKVRYSADVPAGFKVYMQFNCFTSADVSSGTVSPSFTDPAHDDTWYTISGTVTMPANTAYIGNINIYGESTYRGVGTIDVEVVEIRKVIQTAIIDDAAITTAKIANLAVDSAKIADLSVITAKIGTLAVTDAKIASLAVGKITAGSLIADVVLAARIKTADTGARVEINGTGLKQYNAAGQLTVDIPVSGSATFTGQITGSGFSGGDIHIPIRFQYGDAPGQFQADQWGARFFHEGVTNYCLNARFDTLTGITAGASSVVALKKPWLSVGNNDWAQLPMFGKYALKVTATAAGGYAECDLAALEPDTDYVFSWYHEVGKADDTAETNPFPTMYLDWANFKIYERFGGLRQLAVGQTGLYDEAFGLLTGTGYTESSGIGDHGGSGRRHHRFLSFTTPADLAMLAAPTGLATALSGTGGFFGAGTYHYTVTAVVQGGETTPATSVSRVVSSGTTSKITVSWNAVTGAQAYRVYGRGATGRQFLAEVTAPTVSWEDLNTIAGDFWSSEPTVNRTGAIRIRVPAPTDAAGTGTDTTRAVMYQGFQVEEGTYPRQFCYWREPSCFRVPNHYQFSSTKDLVSQRQDDNPVSFLHDREPKISGRILTADVWALNSLKRGTGEAQGTNFVTATKTTSTSLSNGVWTDIPFNTSTEKKEDDGTIWATEQFISQVPGYYGASVCVEFAADSVGTRGLRFRTQGGTILAQITILASAMTTSPGSVSVNMTLADYMRLPGNGYYITIQAYQSSGSSLTLLAHTSSAPQRANFVQVA